MRIKKWYDLCMLVILMKKSKVIPMFLEAP